MGGLLVDKYERGTDDTHPMDENEHDFKALGHAVTDLDRKLETFACPPGVEVVEYTSDEVTSICPITGQPDWYTVTIRLWGERLIESKSLKLYLQSFRNEGHFAEAFASIIAHDVMEQVKPSVVNVLVVQKPRGGVTIKAEANLFSESIGNEIFGT